MSSATDEMPGYLPGIWAIDPAQSGLTFSVGHLGVHTVHGTLSVSGRIVMAEDPLDSAVDATIDLGSVNTGSKGRDKAIRSAHLLDVSRRPTATYRSQRLDLGESPGEFLLHGDLELLGATREVPMRIRLQRSTFGGSQQPVITAAGEFTRRDFGLVYQARPRFLDRAISSSVGVKVRLEVASAAATEGIGR
ncbi:YceI family protein [Mycolicibacterium vulneris]|nr:YceI family protein [Mycolicibacterium vulneris]